MTTARLMRMACAATVLCALNTAPVYAMDLTESEIMETHIGSCVTYWGDSKGTQCYHADGTTEYNDESYGKDTGTWRIKDDQFCVTWSNEGSETCFTYSTDGNGKYYSGGYEWTIDN
ncbi:MAG: hypothetical protein AAF530_21435 [Pseudomonadota bacterium]